MTITPEDVLAVIRRGRANGMTACQLRNAVADRQRAPLAVAVTASSTRKVREAVEALRRAGHPICATPEDGYYLAETDEELSSTIGFLRSRAMTSLVQIAQLRRIALPELMGQLQLELEAAERAAKPCSRSLPAGAIKPRSCQRCGLGPCTEAAR